MLIQNNLTPDELFACRVSLAYGIAPSEVHELGCYDYDLLVRYWREEPWGAYRDNVHTAIIAREIRRGNFKGEHAIKDFLLQTPEKRAQEERAGLFAAFRAMVTKGKSKS